MMVFALLLVLAAIVLTGPAALGGMLKQGPLAAFVSYAAGRSWLDVHQALAILLLVLVAGHLAGVAFETWRSGENLVAAMVTGRKSAFPVAVPTPEIPSRPWAAAAIVLVGALTVSGTALALSRLSVPGLPPAQLDPIYARECGECHIAYAPSLAPATTWAGIMDGLARHFGEDASLDPATALEIRGYLLANSAEHVDTLPANRLRVPGDSDPLRITATAFWQRVHGGISAAAFASRQVGGRGNCTACHRDAATGMFAPQAIELPESLP